MDFLKQVIKSSGNEFASIVEDGLDASDVKDYVDSGSYIFNALLSGSIYGGIPDNKIVALAGESATGKTYFSIGIVKSFLEEKIFTRIHFSHIFRSTNNMHVWDIQHCLLIQILK